MSHNHSLSCRRFDLSTPALVFGGVLVGAAAICGTLDAVSSPIVAIEEVRVVADENSVGPGGFDPYALNCEKETSSIKKASLDSTCKADESKSY